MLHWENLTQFGKYVPNCHQSVQILPYRGYSNANRLFLKGRVVRGSTIDTTQIDASAWDNALNMYKRFGTEVLSGARVRASFQGYQQEVVTDRRGFFEVNIKFDTPLNHYYGWYDVDLKLLAPQNPNERYLNNTGKVLLPNPHARFGVISDIDDTIVYTYNNDWLRMLQVVYLGNAQTRIPFPGISAFYRALHQGKSGQENNPFFYVSSSTWNLYDLLEEFLEINDVPKGPLLLRDLEFALEPLLQFTHEQHKLSEIRPIFDFYPKLKFILIGDSAQRDAKIYHQIAREYPNQILAIYIRNVMPTDLERRKHLNAIAESVQQMGIPFKTVPDTLVAATFAVRQGWMRAEALPEIQAVKNNRSE